MTPSDLRQRIKARVDRLSEERLPVADDFLAYLAEVETAEATDELLRIPGIAGEVRESREEADRGEHSSIDDIRWK